MNKTQRIKASAMAVADKLTLDPADREAVANLLIDLVGRMVESSAKCLAVDGEVAMTEDEDGTGYARYKVGESLMRGARWASEQAIQVSPGEGCHGQLSLFGVGPDA